MIKLLKLSDAPWQIDLLAGFACLILAMLPISIILVRLDFKRTQTHPKRPKHCFTTNIHCLRIPSQDDGMERDCRRITLLRLRHNSSATTAHAFCKLLPIRMVLHTSGNVKKESDTSYRQNHRKLGYLSASLMYLTALSGLGIYYLGFFN